MTDEKIKSLDGQEFSAFCARPDVGGGPCVLVIHDIFGVNAEIQSACGRLAKAGFVAVAPDLFWRQKPDAAKENAAASDTFKAFELYKKFDVEAAVRDLLAVVAFARRLPGCNGTVCAYGYGLGGKLAYLMAARSDVECSVCFYGVGLETVLDEVPDVRTPLLLHVPEQDKFTIPSARAKILAATTRNACIRVELYPSAQQAFVWPEEPTYDAAAAAQAEKTTEVFLEEYMRDKR